MSEFNAEALEHVSVTTDFPDELRELITRFVRDNQERNLDETTLRVLYLNPLLEFLGWDPLNKDGRSPKDIEVTYEESLRSGGNSTRPDYAFTTDGQTRFYLEAKRPSVNIADSASPAHQLRRYGWTAGVKFGLLTDFEEFAIYDCRQRPEPDHSTHVGRVAYFRIDELEENWPLLYGMFGRENVAEGILESLAEGARAPSGTRTIDMAFLEEIRAWRHQLAEDISVRNPKLTGLELGAVVQQLIDRIIFLRIAEARGLEAEEELKRETEDPERVYANLTELFIRADDRYNSGLFRLTGADDDPRVDRLSPSLDVDGELLRSIVERLYYPEPYEFSVMPADILGRIYEQFLGERIVLHEDRSVTQELRPEYRKSGGVYYTPEPIVQYIVEETLGPLLEGKNPASLKRGKFALVDPAAGSGSFLIAAYQFLLDWHRDHWAEQPRNRKRYLETGADGQLRVKTNERKRILVDYVFGVDIDAHAVEVTKLSLMLKVIDGEVSTALHVGRLLPDLDNNILCGNSLIDHDFQMPIDTTPEEAVDYNPFSWRDSFPEIFGRGGFDAVIGNPPYLNIDSTWGKNDPRLAYLKAAYSEIHTDKTDLLFYFLRKAGTICRGEVGFIVSRSFLEADKAQKLRGWLANNLRVRSLFDFRHAIVFPRVGINTAIVRLTKSTAAREASFVRFRPRQLRPGYGPGYLRSANLLTEVAVPHTRLTEAAWNFASPTVQAILDKIDAGGTPIGEILHIGKGMETAANQVFEFSATWQRIEELTGEGLLYERARNSDIQPYLVNSSGRHYLYVEDVDEFDDLPSDVRAHLQEHRAKLEGRAAYVRGDCDWWRFAWPLHRTRVNDPRIIVPYRASSNRFALDEEAHFLGLTDTTVLYENDQLEDLRYILGVLNSRILTARFRFIGKLVGGGTLEYFENTVSRLPIPRLSPGDQRHDRMVELVEQVEQASDDYSSSRIEAEKIAASERRSLALSEIEEITAELFGLTAAERGLLEEELE